jgi:glutamate/tyrosine decarboxylase-like PLP-dependent enzyme
MNILDNEAGNSLTARERAMLTMLGRMLHYTSELRGSNFIGGDDAASADMRQRADGLRRAAHRCIMDDKTLAMAWYGC